MGPMPDHKGKLTPNAPLAPLVWFKAGGAADWLFEPKDVADLQHFLAALAPEVPVMALGLGSNLIVRDGGVPGVVIRLGKPFAKVTARDAVTLDCGGGAYGREVKDVLIDCDVIDRTGGLARLDLADLGYAYRHSDLTDGSVVVSARFRGEPGEPAAIQAEMDRISAAREASQPLRSKTGGSTFKNPEGHKAWALVDAAGCRGLTRGGAQVSEKHTNFLINTGEATSTDIEALGEDVRARVKETQGVELQWEIKRVGRMKPADLP